MTIQHALQHIPDVLRCSVADLSCGNGVIACSIQAGNPDELHLGDMATQLLDAELPGVKYHGPIEETIHLLPSVELYVCSETLEHLDDPGKVLALIRTKAERLLLTTPVGCWGDTNEEHYYAWDREGVEDLMVRAGWRPGPYTELDGRAFHPASYVFGIWVAD